MSDTPHDAASLIAWFTSTEIVRHDGSRSPREPQRAAVKAARVIIPTQSASK